MVSSGKLQMHVVGGAAELAAKTQGQWGLWGAGNHIKALVSDLEQIYI